MTGKGFPCVGGRAPHSEARVVSRDSVLGWVSLPGPAPGRTQVRTPRPPPRGEPSPGSGPAGLGSQGAARAKGEGPAAASASACGGGRRGRTRAEGEGAHLGEVPVPGNSTVRPHRPGSALRTQREVSQKKMPRAPRGRGAARSRCTVREPRPTMQGASGVHGVGVQTGGLSGPRPRRPGERSPLRPAVQPAREEGAAAAGARDAAIPAERCGAAPTQDRPWTRWI